MGNQVNTGLAQLSDQLILVTVLLYLGAMIGYALELAFGRPRGQAPARRTREPVAVGAGAAGRAETDTAQETGDAGETGAAVPYAPWATTVGRVAVAVSWLGWAANLAGIVTRGVSAGRWPWGNMYEFTVAICFAAVTTFLVLGLRQRIRFLGAFVMVAAVLGLGFAVRYLYVQAGPVVPALNSYWLALHVGAAIIASGLFFLAGVTGVLYLVRRPGAVRLPDRRTLERVMHRAIVLAFPIWTFAVIAGALWADRAWGRYWGWDPKEVWSFITWLAYAAYLHAYATAGWRGTRSVIIQLVACGCLLFNLVGVNLFFGSLHSYADIPG